MAEEERESCGVEQLAAAAANPTGWVACEQPVGVALALDQGLDNGPSGDAHDVAEHRADLFAYQLLAGAQQRSPPRIRR